MNLAPAPADVAICDEAYGWLEAWLPDDYEARLGDYRLDLGFRAAYQRAAFDAGWLMPSWERSLGGHDVGPEAELWIKLGFARRQAPKLPNVAGPGVIAHALLAHGTPEQRGHARALLRGDEWWCLGMSEPDAGSDLAALRTRARRHGSGFVIDGQKIWTSNASDSAHCLLFARTSSELPRHRGISTLIVPMDAPGITVRPIDKIGAQDEEFCEVFFDDVAVDEHALLGELNHGWGVAMASLTHERDMIWIMNLVEVERALEVAEAGIRPEVEASLRPELARLAADADAIWLTGLRGLANRLAGRPDVEVPLLKVFSTEAAQRGFLLAARAVGEDAVLSGAGAPFGGEIFTGEIEALGATIYGGTSEVQRNIIGERILGLPRG